jgi:cytochrome c biogenesis protein CcmG, thiol:disulfide interchange protein DsbE
VNRFILPVVIFLALASALYVAVVHSPNKSTMQSALLGKPAPAFDLPVIDDPSVTLSTGALAGKPWVLNVWGTWCAGCRDEHEVLLEVARENRVPIVGMAWKDDDARVQQWLQQLGNPYFVVPLDRDGRAAINYGVYGAPETFFIDGTGIVRYRHVGPMTREVWNREFLGRLPRTALP